MKFPGKGLKYLILLLVPVIPFPSFAEAEPEADPDYIYVKENKEKSNKNRFEKRGSLTPTNNIEVPQETVIEEPVVPIIETTVTEPLQDQNNEVKDLPVIVPEQPIIPLPTVQPEETIIVEEENEPEEFKREIESVDFVPKGQWIIGLSVSYTQSNQDKYQFLILEGISGNTYSFKISPMVMFTVKADLALGARFSYARTLTKVANADIVLDSETDYSFDHLYRLSHNYYGAALMRNYFSIGKSKRFGFFNEVSLQMGGGQTKLTTGVGDDLTGTYERNFSLNLGLTPGLCIFLSNYSALEVNVGLLGFNYTDTKSVKDQIYVSKRNSKSANFRINLFSITFGATFYL